MFVVGWLFRGLDLRSLVMSVRPKSFPGLVLSGISWVFSRTHPTVGANVGVQSPEANELQGEGKGT
jgi:hypothetical protein